MRHVLEFLRKVDFLDLRAVTWLDVLLIAGLLGVALDWRLCHYTWKGIWLDESFSLMTACMDNPILTICYRNMMGDNPALFEFILHFVVNKFGIELYIARLPSILFSTVTVYFIYRILRDFAGRGAGLVGGLFYAYQNYSITYAHEIRGYALLGLFTAMAIWGFLRWIESPEDWRFQITTLMASLGAAYTQNFGLWVIIVQIIFILATPSIRKRLNKYYWSYMGLFVLAYAPQGVLTASVFLSGIESWAPRPGWAHWSYMITHFLNGVTFWIYHGEAQAKDWLTLSVMFITAFALFRAYFLNRGFERLLYLTFSGFGVMFMKFLFSQLRSAWLDRYLMPTSIGFLVMIVSVIFSYPLLWRAVLLAGLGWIFGKGAHSYSLPNLGTDRLVNAIKQVNPHGRYAMFIYPYYLIGSILYHYDRQLFWEGSRNTYDPLEKMRILGEEKHIWAPDDSVSRFPCWYKEVDTALIVVKNRNSPLLKAIEAEFIVADQPVYEEAYLPLVLLAHRKNKPEMTEYKRDSLIK